jgi:hypothetical protein
MELNGTQIARLAQHLREKYLSESGVELFWKATQDGDYYLTSPGRYQLLADRINSSSKRERVSADWLKNLYSKHLQSGAGASFHNYILNPCCQFLNGTNANTYFKTTVAHPDYYGRYRVWRFSPIQKFSKVHFHHGFDVEINAGKIELFREGEPGYHGTSAVLLNNKLHIEMNNAAGTEKVYFILHVAEASGTSLNYIPGVFAAGDRTNTIPSCGLVLFVRQEIEPELGLLKAYFEKHQTNNLIRSWTIADVLEEWGKQSAITPHAQKTEDRDFFMNQKLEWFLGQKFYCYYYRSFESGQGREDAIGRGVCEIGDSPGSVKLTTIGIENQVVYTGSISLPTPHILSFNLMSETNERHLLIHYHIATGEMHHFAVGTYSNVGNKGEPIAGTSVLEHIPKSDVRLTAVIWRKSDLLYLTIHQNIRRFFTKRNKNYIVTPAKGIFSHEDFDLFFSEQETKTHRERPFTPDKTHVFIASPMSSQIEDYKEIRPYIIEVLHFLRQEAKVEAYYAGEKYDPDTTFRLQTYLETQIDLKELRQADHLFLIHPGRVASSSLVEVGYALGQRKTCHIFTKNRKDLPFLLRNLRQPNVFFHEYNDIKEILELIRQIISQSEYRNQGL